MRPQPLLLRSARCSLIASLRSGHVAAVTAVAWHPKNHSLFLTASFDSTLRIWDRENRRKSKSVIVVKSKERGGKTKVTACAWSPDGKTIAAGAWTFSGE